MKTFRIIVQIFMIALVSFLMLLVFGLTMFGMGNIGAVTAVSIGATFKNEGLLIAVQIIFMLLSVLYVATYRFLGYAVSDREKFSKWMILFLSVDSTLMVIRTLFVPMISQRQSIWLDRGYSDPDFSHHPFIFISSVLAICVLVLLKHQSADYIAHPKLAKRFFYIVCILILVINAFLRIFISYEPEPFFG